MYFGTGNAVLSGLVESKTIMIPFVCNVSLFSNEKSNVTNDTIAGNFSPYLISYLRNRTDDVNLRNVDGLWITTFGGIGNGFGMTTGGLLDKRFGPRVATGVGSVLFRYNICNMLVNNNSNHGVRHFCSFVKYFLHSAIVVIVHLENSQFWLKDAGFNFIVRNLP